MQGCPHHCEDCFNQETWDFNKGKELTPEVMDSINNGIHKNGVKRSLCILGGEPLCPENKETTLYIIKKVKEKYPKIKIYIWTGYIFEFLFANSDKVLNEIFNSIYCLVDGPFVKELKDLNLKMRGSKNQNIYYFY